MYKILFIVSYLFFISFGSVFFVAMNYRESYGVALLAISVILFYRVIFKWYDFKTRLALSLLSIMMSCGAFYLANVVAEVIADAVIKAWTK